MCYVMKNESISGFIKIITQLINEVNRVREDFLRNIRRKRCKNGRGDEGMGSLK